MLTLFDQTDCFLKENQVDLWEIPLDTPTLHAFSLLSEDETERANRFHFEHHRQRFATARASLRIILSRYLQQDPKKLAFSYGQHGKPYIAEEPALQFNLSHSNNLALLAIGKTHPLGVDIEFFSKRPYQGIARHVFSPEETKTFKQLPSYLKPILFFRLWAKKESFIKACGMGLSYPVKQLHIGLDLTAQETLYDPLHHQHWQLYTHTTHPLCAAALCHHPSIKKIRHTTLIQIE